MEIYIEATLERDLTFYHVDAVLCVCLILKIPNGQTGYLSHHFYKIYSSSIYYRFMKRK